MKANEVKRRAKRSCSYRSGYGTHRAGHGATPGGGRVWGKLLSKVVAELKGRGEVRRRVGKEEDVLPCACREGYGARQAQ